MAVIRSLRRRSSTGPAATREAGITDIAPQALETVQIAGRVRVGGIWLAWLRRLVSLELPLTRSARDVSGAANASDDVCRHCAYCSCPIADYRQNAKRKQPLPPPLLSHMHPQQISTILITLRATTSRLHQDKQHITAISHNNPILAIPTLLMALDQFLHTIPLLMDRLLVQHYHAMITADHTSPRIQMNTPIQHKTPMHLCPTTHQCMPRATMIREILKM
jgi:hypothetical protein